MVFTSVPPYLGPPNWQQHPNQQQQQQQLQGNGTGNNNDQINHHQHLIPPPSLPQLPPHHHQVGLGDSGGAACGSPSTRPNSMAERARLAKIPPPEAPLKCPRCESTNTKFCYFNNYSLSQPRHFCKTCRRYWTRGGALRNVPVGGGCRRNKRSSSSKSSSISAPTAATTTSNSTSSLSSVASLGPAIGGIPSGGFMASLQSIAQLGMSDMGLSFGGSTLHGTPLDQLDHYGSTTSNINTSLLNHQLSSFPNFLGGFEFPGSSSSFQNIVGSGGDDDQARKGTSSMTNMSSMMGAAVKMENRQGGLNIDKGLHMGISASEMNATSTTAASNGHFWGSSTMAAAGGNGNSMWNSTTHLSGLNSTSTAATSHLL